MAEACLIQDDNITTMILAAEVSREARKLEPHVRKRLEIRLDHNLETDDPILRRQTAEILLNRRLQFAFQPIDEQLEIDLSPITCAEFQLFLDDMLTQNQYAHPEHWMNIRFSSGDAKKPILGVSFRTSEQFCLWLTQKQGDSYRLPKEDEIQSFLLSCKGFIFYLQNRKLCNEFSEIQERYRKQLLLLSDLPLPPLSEFENIIEVVMSSKKEIVCVIEKVVSKDTEIFSEKINHINKKQIELHDRITKLKREEINLSSKYEKIMKQRELLLYKIKCSQAEDIYNTNIQELKNQEDELIAVETDITYFRESGGQSSIIQGLFGSSPSKLLTDIQTEKNRIHRKISELEQILAENQNNKHECYLLEGESLRIHTQLENNRSLYKQDEAMSIITQNELIKCKTQYDFILKTQSYVDNIIDLLLQNKYEYTSLLVSHVVGILDFFESGSMRKALVQEDFSETGRLIEEFLNSSPPEYQCKQVILLKAAIKTLTSQTSPETAFFEWRRAHYELGLLLAEYAYEGSQKMQTVDAKVQQTVLDLYWHYRIILARMDGQLPAWEGICLVRERKEQ